jgi:hypothetical protein
MDGAVEHLLAATRPELTGDLRQLAERGLRLPAWIMQLAAGDRQLRVQLARSLRYLYDSRVTDELAALAPVAELAQQRLVHRLADGGIDELFAGLRPHFRWIPPRTLAFETTDASVDFDFESPGRGLVLVPSPWLRSTPSLYLPAGDHSSRKVMVFYPAGPLLARTGVRSDLARVAELLGRTRSRILLCLAERPALSTHELATAVGISPASASEHAAVLRRNHLVVTTRVGHRTVHTISPIGIQLID